MKFIPYNNIYSLLNVHNYLLDHRKHYVIINQRLIKFYSCIRPSKKNIKKSFCSIFNHRTLVPKKDRDPTAISIVLELEHVFLKGV